MKNKVIKLKLSEEYFDDVNESRKNFEVRFNDRGYCVGDMLILMEWSNLEGGSFTGRECVRVITYMCDLGGMGLKGYVGLGICTL